MIDESIGRFVLKKMNLLVDFSTYILFFFLPLCMFLIGHFGGSLAVDRGSRGFLYSCTFYGFLLKILVLLISILSVALTLMYHLSACVIQKKRYLGRRSWRILIRWENVNKAWECLALKVVIRHYTSVRKIRTRSNLFIMEKWFLL